MKNNLPGTIANVTIILTTEYKNNGSTPLEVRKYNIAINNKEIQSQYSNPLFINYNIIYNPIYSLVMR